MDDTAPGRELEAVTAEPVAMNESTPRANAWVLRSVAFLAFLTTVAVVVPKPKLHAAVGPWGPFRVSPTAVTLHAMSSFLLVGVVAALLLVGLSADRKALIWRPLASLVAAVGALCYPSLYVRSTEWAIMATGWSAGAIAVVLTRRLRLDDRLAPVAQVVLARPAAGCAVLAAVAQGWGQEGMDSRR